MRSRERLLDNGHYEPLIDKERHLGKVVPTVVALSKGMGVLLAIEVRRWMLQENRCKCSSNLSRQGKSSILVGWGLSCACGVYVRTTCAQQATTSQYDADSWKFLPRETGERGEEDVLGEMTTHSRGLEDGFTSLMTCDDTVLSRGHPGHPWVICHNLQIGIPRTSIPNHLRSRRSYGSSYAHEAMK